MSAVLSSPLRPMPPGLPTGISRDVPASDYHKRTLGVVSNSALSRLAVTPAHYRAWLDEEDEETPAMAFGKAFHCALLEPEKFPNLFPVMPEFSGKGSVSAREFWISEQMIEARPIKAEQAAKIGRMVASVRRHPVAGKIIDTGATEVTAVWQDSETGLWNKSRADFWHEGRAFLLDVKTTNDASPAAFARSVANYRYHVQQAIYSEGWQRCGHALRHYVLLAVESEPPHCCALYSLDAAAEAKGFELLYKGRRKLAECLDSDTWPAYGDKTIRLSLPRWATQPED